MNTKPSFDALAITALLLAPLFSLGCGDDGSVSGVDGGPGAAPSGGRSAENGAVSGTGGTSAGAGGMTSAGSGGTAAPGGSPGVGGTLASGGAVPGGSSGGTQASGGFESSGGSGGAAATGESGGAAATGGSGGAAATGGSSATGGGTNDASNTWAPLSVMAIVNPKDHGAAGNGTSDDLGPLTASVNALPAAGGIVYLPKGGTFKKTNLLIVSKSHVKFWAPDGQATLFQAIAGQRRRQSVICQRNQGCGFFGVKFTSDAAARFDALEDNHISADHGRLVEVAGCDLDGAAAAGIMLYGSTEHYIEGNYVHHTWADHVHHTDGARESWVWGNYIFNESPSNGDDGVACVTYGPEGPRCGDMEWWKNTILHTGWGRGYSVIGGDAISIHDNWAIGTAGAGVIVASEPSYTTATSDGITIRRNYVTQTGHRIGHPGILISGMYDAAGPIRNVTLTDNVSAANTGAPYRAEGAYEGVTSTGLKTAASDLPNPLPSAASVHRAAAAILRTRDVSHVAVAFRPGLHRIHVRQAPSGTGFQERFEYVVKGATAAVDAFVSARTQAGDHLSEKRDASGTTHALLLTRAPLAIPSGVSGVTFRELRSGDLSGALSWLWQRIDSGVY